MKSAEATPHSGLAGRDSRPNASPIPSYGTPRRRWRKRATAASGWPGSEKKRSVGASPIEPEASSERSGMAHIGLGPHHHTQEPTPAASRAIRASGRQGGS